MSQFKQYRNGVLIGKFHPFHKGHERLISFAYQYVERLTIIVGYKNDDDTPGYARANWIRAAFPKSRVVCYTVDGFLEPHQSSEFWKDWVRSIRAVTNEIDVIFSSEAYGDILARKLDIKHICFDAERRLVPTSSSSIRAKEEGSSQYISDSAKASLVRRVVLMGAESTGKTTLARMIAEHFGTCFAAEYGRSYIEDRYSSLDEVTFEDMSFIAAGELHERDEKASQAQTLLIEDTDLVATQIWSELLFGHAADWIVRAAQHKAADLYLVLDNSASFVTEDVRLNSDLREAHRQRIIDELNSRSLHWQHIRGSLDEKFATAVRLISNLVYAHTELAHSSHCPMEICR